VKPSDWIALAAVLATVTAAVAGYLFSYFQMKQTRTIARDDRLFASRSEAYLKTLRLISHRWSPAYLRSIVENDEAARPPEPFTQEEMEILQAQMDLFASDRVREPFEEFSAAQSNYFFRYGELQGDEEFLKALSAHPEDERFKEHEQQLQATREAVGEAAKSVSAALDEVKRRMREALTYTTDVNLSGPLVAPAVVLLIAEGLHDIDHFRQGRLIDVPVIVLGILAYVGVIAVLVLALRRRPQVGRWAVLVGFGTALGFVGVHLVPDWGPLADGYPGLNVDAVSWASVGVAIVAAAWLGGAGLVLTMLSQRGHDRTPSG